VNFAFAGTPEFAAWVLSNLVGLNCRPSLVISQPDRPRGRGRKLEAPPVMAEAERLGLACIQSEDINTPAMLERMRSAGVSTLAVASFGQILRRPILDGLLCVNIHTSLLPKYRGAAPIERALAAGETSMGISIMRITEGLDEGPCALQTSVSVDLHDDAGSMTRALGVVGAIGLAHVLDGIGEGTVEWTAQEGSASYAHKLAAVDCVLNASVGAREVHNQVRSLSPSIGAGAASGDLKLKVWRTWPYGQAGLGMVPSIAHDVSGIAGQIVARERRLFLGCAEGVVEVLVIQPAGRQRMTAAAFLRGYGGRLGTSLDPVPARSPGVCDER
jgi:methionyl-tRNA formyltransferase